MDGQVLDRLRAFFCLRSPEQRARWAVDTKGVRSTCPYGRVGVVSWSDLQFGGVEITDTSPFVKDVCFS